jgi:hypothetical protein
MQKCLKKTAFYFPARVFDKQKMLFTGISRRSNRKGAMLTHTLCGPDCWPVVTIDIDIISSYTIYISMLSLGPTICVSYLCRDVHKSR